MILCGPPKSRLNFFIRLWPTAPHNLALSRTYREIGTDRVKNTVKQSADPLSAANIYFRAFCVSWRSSANNEGISGISGGKNTGTAGLSDDSGKECGICNSFHLKGEGKSSSPGSAARCSNLFERLKLFPGDGL